MSRPKGCLSRCRACGEIGHLSNADGTQCSKSFLAVRRIELLGETMWDAAKFYGITRQAVSLAWRKVHGDSGTPAMDRNSIRADKRDAKYRARVEERRGRLDERNRRLGELVSGGKSIAEVSSLAGMSYGTVRSICKRLGIVSTYTALPNESGARTKAGIALVESGASLSAAARTVGMSPQCLLVGLARSKKRAA